jgi:DNA-binding winged helix-turn-helix (wHTH) protein
MRASGSTAVFKRLPWPQAPALAQFHPKPELDVRRAVQSPDTDKPFFAKQTKPACAAPTEVSFGPFRLLPRQFLLLEDDKPVSLGSRALEILIVLLERPGELVSRQELMARVWPNIFVEPANLTVHISVLRRTLRDGQDGNRFIINIPRRGYSFVASVAVVGRVEPDGDENRASSASNPGHCSPPRQPQSNPTPRRRVLRFQPAIGFKDLDK